MSNSGNSIFEEVGEVERRTGLSNDEFVREYVLPGKPVVLTDAVQGWRAVSEWSPDAFRKAFGERKVSLKESPNLQFRLDEYLDQLRESNADLPAPYLYGFEIEDIFPELLADMEPEIEFAEPDRLRSGLYPKRFRLRRVSEMLIGGKGSKFPLHFDIYGTHGFVTQVYGDKEFTIFSPSQGKFLYPDPRYPNKSLVADIQYPDMEKFPLLADAKAQRTVVRPGETMFHPGGWWHTTRLLTSSIGIVRSTVSPDMWSQFVRAYCSRRNGILSIKNELKKAYLLGLHPLMSLSEYFHR